MLLALKKRFIDSLYNLLPNSIEENYQQIEYERLLWNNKPIREDSVLLWDLENIAFHRLDEIKRVAKYTPQRCYVVTTQNISDKKRAKIESEHFKLLDAHETISDEKILSLMRLYAAKKEMILISSDSDFAKEANRYIKNNRLQWIVTDCNKKRVTMFVRLDSPNLTLSSIPSKKSGINVKKTISGAQRALFKKNSPSKYTSKIENHYGLKTYLDYYFGRAKTLFLKAKFLISSLLKKEPISAQSKDSQIGNFLKNTQIKNRSKKLKHDIVEKFGLHRNDYSGVSYMHVFRLNQKGMMKICGKVQYNPNGEIILILYQNLKKKYEMPSFEKLIRTSDKRQLEEYIKYDEQNDIFFLNDFKRIETTTSNQHQNRRKND